MADLERNCPDCNCIITYKTKSNMNEAIKNNRKCRKCGCGWQNGLTKENSEILRKKSKLQSISMKKFREKNPPWNKGLTKENNKIIAKLSLNLNTGVPWNKDKSGLQVAWNKGLDKSDPRVQKYIRKVGEFQHTEETKELLRSKVLGKTYEEILGIEKSLETKQKQRKSALKRMDIHKIFFNDLACEYFDWLNTMNEWNGQHALAGGEKQVCGYFVDFYEPTHNIVIEWDEPYHYKKKKFNKDRIREQEIIKELNCDFYRINQETFEWNKVIECEKLLTA